MQSGGPRNPYYGKYTDWWAPSSVYYDGPSYNLIIVIIIQDSRPVWGSLAQARPNHYQLYIIISFIQCLYNLLFLHIYTIHHNTFCHYYCVALLVFVVIIIIMYLANIDTIIPVLSCD